MIENFWDREQPGDARIALCCDPTAWRTGENSSRIAAFGLGGGLIQGKPSGPSQLHCGPSRLKAFRPNRDCIIKRSLEPPIGVELFRVLIARRGGYQFALPPGRNSMRGIHSSV